MCHVHHPKVLIFSFGQYSPAAHWLVALSITADGRWDESDRLVPADNANANIMCALKDSRVLLGQWYSKYQELVSVESAAGGTGSQIKRGRRLRASDDMEASWGPLDHKIWWGGVSLIISNKTNLYL